MVTNFLNALDRIPKLMEQYKSQNATIEKDLPTLREIVGGTWKKEEELKSLKTELTTLERKIQLTFTPAQLQNGHANTTDENLSKIVPEKLHRIPTVRVGIDDSKKITRGIKL